MMSYYWNKFLKWMDKPYVSIGSQRMKVDPRAKWAVIGVVLLILLFAGTRVFAGDRTCGTCPAPTNPTTTTYETKDSGTPTWQKGLVALGLVGGIACSAQWDDCKSTAVQAWEEIKALFTGGSAPAAKADPNPGSIVPASANPKQYDIKTEVSFQ